jgi:two-component system, NtrC family, nitrogen regulation sensor histidine kinase NtrY
MALPFRRRIFLILVAMTAVPVTLAVVGWMLSVSGMAPTAGSRASIEGVGASARALQQAVDTSRLTARERAAYAEHLAAVSNAMSLARRADLFMRFYKGGIALLVVLLGLLVLITSVRVGGHLSRQLSRPIDELVGWTRLIRVREPLPTGPPTRGAPEFQALRAALRELADALAVARERELEAERLRAFREVARRVAHEIKNPLTAMRIAVDQLRRKDGETERRNSIARDVLDAETDRLERLAREFADFGRLPEGPTADVDLTELLQELGQTAVPDGVTVRVQSNGTNATVLGHYEPLRRAFANLLRNAAEAMGGTGSIDVAVQRNGAGIVVTVADHGPGVPRELGTRIFDPYVTTKADGTGLGLALVHQTVGAHHGTISLSDTPGGGATFTVVFPS